MVNVRPADTRISDIPEPFNIHHVDNINDYKGILSTIAKVWEGVPIPTRVPLHEIYSRHYGHPLIEAKQLLVRDFAEISPSELLQAKYGVVPYVDVTGQLTAFIDWCLHSPRMIAGRLLHSPGGFGKTRLMIEVAAKLRAQGWIAGFLEQAHQEEKAMLRQRHQALEQLIAHNDREGLFLVMDYAEGRQEEVKTLSAMMAAQGKTTARRIRLVLLARSAGDWWTYCHDQRPEIQRLFRRDASSADVIALSGIDSGQRRLDLFIESINSLMPILDAQGIGHSIDGPPQEVLRHIENRTGYSRPLAIQVEALLSLASPISERGGMSVQVLLHRLLGLERGHWEKLIGELDEEDIRDMNRGVAQVTAVGGVRSNVSAERLLIADGFYKGRRTARVDVEPLLRNLTKVYGNGNGGLAPIEPDLIAEHQVASISDVESIEGCLRWMATEPEPERRRLQRNLLTVLQRATHPDHGDRANENVCALLEHVVRNHIQELVTDVIAVMTNTPGKLREILVSKLNGLDLAVVRALDFALPLMHLQLLELALGVSQRHVLLGRAAVLNAQQSGVDSIEVCRARNGLGGALNLLGIRLANFGLHEEALRVCEEAVAIRRQLTKMSDDTFLSAFARTLNCLANRYSNLGRREEALQASKEAVAIRRRTRRNQFRSFPTSSREKSEQFEPRFLQYGSTSGGVEGV